MLESWVTSGVLLLVSELLSKFIIDLGGGFNCDISKFADDTKIGRIIRSDYDVIALQEDELNE